MGQHSWNKHCSVTMRSFDHHQLAREVEDVVEDVHGEDEAEAQLDGTDNVLLCSCITCKKTMVCIFRVYCFPLAVGSPF